MFLNLWRRMMKQHFRAFRPGKHASRRPKAATYKPRLEVFEERTLLSVNWIGGSGNWNDSTHWDAGHVPTSTDDAVIDVPGITVTHDNLIDSANSIRLLDSTSTLLLANDILGVSNGLTVNGTVQLGALDGSTTGSLFFSNTQTVDGSGSILFGGSQFNELRLQNEGTTVTLASTLTIHGTSGHFQDEGSTTRTWVNQTTIAADVSGGTITLDGPWTNSNGAFSAGDGALLNFSGTMTNTNSTLTASVSGTGRVQLASGTIIGGTVAGTLTGAVGGTLDGVTLAGTLDLGNAFRVNVLNGLTVNGTVLVGASGGSTAGSMVFNNTQTVGGSGSIVLGGNTGNELILGNDGTIVTLASTLTIHGTSGTLRSFGSPTDAWVSQGTIAADGSGGTITLTGLWTNSNGTFSASDGATIHFDGNSTMTNTASTLTASVSGSGQVTLDGTIIGGTVSGTLTGSIFGILDGVTLAGTLDLTNSSMSVKDGITVNGTVQVGALNGSSSGSMFFTNTETIDGNGSIVLGGSPNNHLVLQNDGTIVTLASTLTIHGTSGSLFPQSANDAWVNQGTIAADGSGGTITLAGSWTNNGTLQALNGGNFTTGNISNNGTLTIGPGSIFSVIGDYTQGPSGTLEVQLGGTADTGQFGQMVVTGAVNLAGTLTATVVGGYSPTTGDTFPVLTYGSRSGDFDTGPNGFDYSFDDINHVMTLVAQ